MNSFPEKLIFSISQIFWWSSQLDRTGNKFSSSVSARTWAGLQEQEHPLGAFLDVGFVQPHRQGIYSDFCQQTSPCRGAAGALSCLQRARDQPWARRISASSVVWLHLCDSHWIYASLCVMFILKRRGLSLAKRKDFSGGERLVQLETAAC